MTCWVVTCTSGEVTARARVLGGILIVARFRAPDRYPGAHPRRRLHRIAATMLTIVAIPSVVAEHAFTVSLLLAGRRSSTVTRDDVRAPALR